MKPPPGLHYILLFRGRGIISTLIRWQTRSQYSHAAILLPDGETIIEAWQFRGVQKRKMKDWKGVDAFVVLGMTEKEHWPKAVAYAESQIGKGYDYRGVTRFLTRIKNPEDDRLFCSELVFSACLDAGKRLLNRITPGEVAPSHLSLAPDLYGPVPGTRA